MSKQQGLKSTNLTKIFISSENELWEWLDVNHASEQSFLLVTWKKQDDEQLRILVSENKNNREISSILGRQTSAIRSRKEKLEL